MKKRHLILVTLVCTLFSATLSAQEQAPQETSLTPSVNPASSANAAAKSQAHAARTRGPYFYLSAKQHPLTPREVSIREAVESLGIDKHRFVLCKLKDGSHLVGGISDIHFASFAISQGIMDGREIKYSDLKEAPQSVPAVGEHLANGLKWTGLVAVCVALSPLAVIFYPLVLAGVLTD